MGEERAAQELLVTCKHLYRDEDIPVDDLKSALVETKEKLDSLDDG